MVTNNVDNTLDAEVFVGFDLGHGETCLVRVYAEGDDRPAVLEVDSHHSFPTALARNGDSWYIGKAAFTTDTPQELDIGFKSKPTTSDSWDYDRPRLVRFARECYNAIRKYLPSGTEGQRFIIGCPTGWVDDDITAYRGVFVDAGLPNPCVVKESRAAFIHAKDSRLIPPEKLTSAIIVIDIGSSTTDITYLKDLKVVDVVNVRESYLLGAGIIDEYLFTDNLRSFPDSPRWDDYFGQHPADRNEAFFACRQLKEEFFSSDRRRRDLGVERLLRYPINDRIERLIFSVDTARMERALTMPVEKLRGLSWMQAYRKLIEAVKSRVTPEYVLLGGGASRMDFTADLCCDVFKDSIHGFKEKVLRHDAEPQTAVASGLGRLGRWEFRCKKFQVEVEKLFVTERLYATLRPHVGTALNGYMLKSFKALYSDIMPGCIDDWKAGSVHAREGLVLAVRNKSIEWERSDAGTKIKNDTAHDLLHIVMVAVEKDAAEICNRYYIPPKQLRFYLDIGNVPYTEALTRMLDITIVKKMDEFAGELVDQLPKWEWFTKLTKGSVRLYGKYATWVMDKTGLLIGEYLPDERLDAIAKEFSESICEQLLQQFRQQIDDVKVWIQ